MLFLIPKILCVFILVKLIFFGRLFIQLFISAMISECLFLHMWNQAWECSDRLEWWWSIISVTIFVFSWISLWNRSTMIQQRFRNLKPPPVLSVLSLVISLEQGTFLISREHTYAPCFKLVIAAKHVIYFKQTKILTHCLWPLNATYKIGNCWTDNLPILYYIVNPMLYFVIN